MAVIPVLHYWGGKDAENLVLSMQWNAFWPFLSVNSMQHPNNPVLHCSCRAAGFEGAYNHSR